MASSLVRTNKLMKRTDLKKSHSWWWDSHVSSKNSKWLAENLEEMDQSVKRMLKLIEEDADSFAKKAEMYYQKRPELITLVEEFYRMYRSLAERYDHVTGELRKNIPSDLQSQGSGISDVGSEVPSSTWPSSPDQRLSRRKSGPRAAGFEFFLGFGRSSSDLCNKEGDETSTLDSESESDDSSVNNYSSVSGNGDDQGVHRKIIELEVELRDVKEKLRVQQEENSDGSFRGRNRNVNLESLLSKISEYDVELRLAKENIRVSEEEIAKLKMELQKYESSGFTSNLQADRVVSSLGSNLEVEKQHTAENLRSIDVLAVELLDPERKTQKVEEDLKVTKEKLWGSENEIAKLKKELSSVHGLQDQLKLAQKEVTTWKGKIDKEKREVSKLQDRIVRYKANLSDRDQEIRGLREAISNANKSLSEDNSQLQADISKLTKERAYLEDNLKEWEFRCQSLEEEVRRAKVAIEELKKANVEQGDRIEELNKSLDAFKLKYDKVIAERDELGARVLALIADVSCRDDRIDQINTHMHQLQTEHVELIGGTEVARKLVVEMRSRVEELEREVEKQNVVISEGAEEKREAIRQLCFSIEHYRDGYHNLRQAFVGQKRLPIMAFVN